MNKRINQPDRSTTLNQKHSLILRLWREDQPGSHDWRASVEIPETGRRIGFSSLEQLFAFLIDFSESNFDMADLENK